MYLQGVYSGGSGTTPPPPGMQSDLHQTNPAAIDFVKNKIDWSNTYANIEAVRAASGLYAGMRYKITDRGSAGIIVTALSTNSFGLMSIFIANYSGTIVGESAIYNFITDTLISRMDGRNNCVTNTSSYNCLSTFQWGNAAYTNNKILNCNLTLSATATLVNANEWNYMGISIGANRTVACCKGVIGGTLDIAAGAGFVQNLQMFDTPIITIGAAGVIKNVQVYNEGTIVTINGTMQYAQLRSCQFTLGVGQTMTGSYEGLLTPAFNLYTGGFNPGNFVTNLQSTLEATVDMAGSNTFTNLSLQNAGVFNVENASVNIDDIITGTLNTPVKIQPTTGTLTINDASVSGGKFVLGNGMTTLTLDAAKNEYVLFRKNNTTGYYAYIISVPTCLADDPIVTADGVVNPDVFANGVTYGDGTTMFLDSVINPDTLAFFTDPDADIFFGITGINVATWTVDDAVIEACFRYMEGDMVYGMFRSPSNKVYVLNQPHERPRVKDTSSTNRAYQFVMDFQTSVVRNIGTGNPTVFYGQPADQDQAVNDANNWAQYAMVWRNLQMEGVDDGTTMDIGIEAASSYNMIFENCSWYNFHIGTYVVFGLQNFFVNCKWSDSYTYGVYVTWGDWSGGSITGNGSNGTSFTGCKWRCAPGSIAGLYAEGSDGISIVGLQNVFEGSASGVAPEHHIVINGLGATTVKMCTIENLHFEQVCNRSNIFMTTNAQTIQLYFRGAFVQGVNNAFIEADTNAGGVIQCNVENIPDNSSGWLMRQNGAGDGVFNFSGARLNNLSSATDAANWDTSSIGGVVGVIPHPSLVFMSGNIMW